MNYLFRIFFLLKIISFYLFVILLMIMHIDSLPQFIHLQNDLGNILHTNALAEYYNGILILD